VSGTSRHDYERHYDPPLAAIGEPGVFRARVWYRVMLVVLFGGIAAPMLVMGPLYLTGLFQPPGMSTAELWTGGILSMAFGLVLGTAAVLIGVQVVSRRGAVLRACREGLEIRVFGPSRVYGVPSAPGPVRLAWALLSGRPCRLPMMRVSWETLTGVRATGEALSRVLIVQWKPEPAGQEYYFTVSQAEIAAPVGEVAGALSSWAGGENARASLPGWGDPAWGGNGDEQGPTLT
jgi:hypothetical protein